MTTIVPPTYHEVTHFYDGASDSDDGLASDQEWASEIEEEIITVSLSRNMDTSLLTTSPKARSVPLPRRPSPDASPAGPSAKQIKGQPAKNHKPFAKSTKPTKQTLNSQDDNDDDDRPAADDLPSDEDPNDGTPRPNARAGPSNERESQQPEDGNDEQEEVPAAHTCSIIGLNTTTPYLKVNNQVFKGRVVELIGTELVWEMKDSREVTSLPLLPSLQTVHFQPRQYEPARPGDKDDANDGWTPEPDFLLPRYLSKRGKTTCFSSDDDLSPSVFSDGGTTKIRNPNSTRPRGRPPGIKNSYTSRRSRGPKKPPPTAASRRGLPRSGPGSRGGKIRGRGGSRGSRGGKPRGGGRMANLVWAVDSDAEDDDLDGDESDASDQGGPSRARPRSVKKTKEAAASKRSPKGKGKGRAKVVDSDDSDADSDGSPDDWDNDNNRDDEDDEDDDDEMQSPPPEPVAAPAPSRPRRQATVNRRVVIDAPPDPPAEDDMQVDQDEPDPDLPAGVQAMEWNSD